MTPRQKAQIIVNYLPRKVDYVYYKTPFDAEDEPEGVQHRLTNEICISASSLEDILTTEIGKIGEAVEAYMEKQVDFTARKLKNCEIALAKMHKANCKWTGDMDDEREHLQPARDYFEKYGAFKWSTRDLEED